MPTSTLDLVRMAKISTLSLGDTVTVDSLAGEKYIILLKNTNFCCVQRITGFVSFILTSFVSLVPKSTLLGHILSKFTREWRCELGNGGAIYNTQNKGFRQYYQYTRQHRVWSSQQNFVNIKKHGTTYIS